MKININYLKDLHFTAEARHFKDIHIDEPESFHGTNSGPSSVEYLLIGIGGCLASTLAHCLNKNLVPINKLDIIVDGRLKHTGPSNRLRLIEIFVEILVSTENTHQKALDSCIRSFQEFCPIAHALTNGIPVNVNVSKKKHQIRT
ncbi:MAG: hypothetical protein GF383_07685 [Candidatus Lokiarchaeota archaeon]|nr:hypothetical protein [Candidatus Lokiarchaeota archaeon]MBD3340152.1 hypothetical protein [Candidatus Lokiarchaeota archaeon]